jgi:hypothetical protein
MEWKWEISYLSTGPLDGVIAAQLEVDEISYDLIDAKGDIVWSAPLGAIRNVTRRDVLPQPPAAAPTA